jgi:hypothetical protein
VTVTVLQCSTVGQRSWAVFLILFAAFGQARFAAIDCSCQPIPLLPRQFGAKSFEFFKGRQP